MKFIQTFVQHFDRFVKILINDWLHLLEAVKVRRSPKPLSKQQRCGRFKEEERTPSEPSAVDLDVPLGIAIFTYVGYCVMVLFGYLNDLLRYLGVVKVFAATEKGHTGYVPLYSGFEHFFKRNIYRRVRDGWNRPISSVPGPLITLRDRVTHDHGWSFEYTGKTSTSVNMGSYNYLGFAENTGPRIDAAQQKIQQYGLGISSTRRELGTCDMHIQLEKELAKFLGVEDAITFGMGFATNSMNLPTFMNKGCLIISDELNHASLILGSRLSQSHIKVFKHNDMEDLEKRLRESIIYGQPRTHQPWKKILIVVEGIYSMEGTIVNLPEVIRLKKKYKAYLYLDEAHSMGALGSSGRGVVEHWGCNPKDIDIMMGTFTKSFAAGGGYIAGPRNLINFLRTKSHAVHYSSSISIPLAQQIISVLRVLSGEDGSDDGKKRVKNLADNTRYFRSQLQEMGFIIYGDDNSPVIPLLHFMIGKTVYFTRMSLEHGIALVGVGFPATPFTKSRARFCISAMHTKEMLDKTLDVCDRLGDMSGLKYLTPRHQGCSTNAHH